MSIAALCLNGFLATLLLAALAMGLRLDKKLKGVRDGQSAFVLAVHELNAAAAKAQTALADLRAATDEATDTLGGRISRAREVADRLDRLVARGEAMPAMPAQGAAAPRHEADQPLESRGGLAALLARLDGAAETVRPAPRTEAAPQPAYQRPPRVRRPSIDDDLFVDLGDRA